MAEPTPHDPERMSAAQLQELLEAPDLSKRERRELQRAVRFQRRVEKWEAQRSGPQPRKLHRAVISLLMMAFTLWVLWLLLSGPPG